MSYQRILLTRLTILLSKDLYHVVVILQVFHVFAVQLCLQSPLEFAARAAVYHGARRAANAKSGSAWMASVSVNPCDSGRRFADAVWSCEEWVEPVACHC